MKSFYKNIELDCTNVYEPREDSFLLAKVLEGLELRNKKILDMGCGSGLLGIIAANMGAMVTSVDVKEPAIAATKNNAKTNNVKITTLLSDLFTNVEGVFDVIVFNTPYLPYDEYADKLKGSETWSAGKSLDIYRRFFKDVAKHLKSDGKIFILSSSLTGIQLNDIIRENGFNFRVVTEQKVPWETLYVTECYNDSSKE